MDPYTIGIAIKAVQALKKSLDAAALQERVEAIDEAVGAIGRHLADSVVAEVHAGFTHLEAAMTIAEPSVREDELRFARLTFNRLAQRSGNDQLLDDYTVMGAQHVAALGHLGNYHYFLLRDQPEQALLCAYRCTEQFPALGVWLFPVELFSQDYRGEVPSPRETRGPLLADYRLQRARYQDTRRRYRLDLAWRVPAAAGYIIAGLAAATVSPPMAAHGVQGAMGLLATTNEGILPPTAPDKQAFLQRAAEAEERLQPVRDEARERRVAVQRHLS
jgi:hypothetical protein